MRQTSCLQQMKQLATVDRTTKNIKCPSNLIWLHAERWLVIYEHCSTVMSDHLMKHAD